MTVIPTSAFVSCNNLTSVIIPDSVTEIQQYAFAHTNVTDIYYTGTEEEWAEVTIIYKNDQFNNPTIHYNYTE